MPEQSADQRPPGADLAEIRARGSISRVPWMGGEAMAPRAAEAVARAVAPSAAVAPSGPSFPVPVDRSIALEDFTRDINIVVDGRIIAVLRRSAGYPSGRLPGDPSRWVPESTPGTAVCDALSPRAAARCLAAWR